MNITTCGLNNIIGAPLGLPVGLPTQTFVNHTITNTNNSYKPAIPGEGLKRAVNYLADYGGCGFYRCIGPNLLLNLNQKAVIYETTSMILDDRYYQHVNAVKFQRQATAHQANFVKLLKALSKRNNMKLIYEIDDVVFAEEIPMYNRNRDAFTTKEVQDSILEILNNMDEIIVTTDYFRDYVKSRTGLTNVTSIPNYLMKWWFDRYYDLSSLIKNYNKNKKKPIIAIFASGTHVDVANQNNQVDDFTEVVKQISKTRTEYNWHFYGCIPVQLREHVKTGQIKHFPWVDLTKFPETMANSGAQLTFAALQDNTFNRCKSDIKLIEAGALGMPCICPDMVTYKNALVKYKTGDELIDCIKSSLKHESAYVKLCKESRAHAEKYWLDDEINLMKHHEGYFTSYGSSDRKFIK